MVNVIQQSATFRVVPAVHLVHVNVPDHDYKGVSEGWEKYYWQPWREYLRRGSV